MQRQRGPLLVSLSESRHRKAAQGGIDEPLVADLAKYRQGLLVGMGSAVQLATMKVDLGSVMERDPVRTA